MAYLVSVPAYYIAHAIQFYRELRSLRKKMEAAEAFNAKEQAENKLAILEK